MIVRLTNQQLGRIGDILAGPRSERLVEWLDRDITRTSAQRIDVFMPAIGWLQIENQLFNFCYDERGYRARGVRNCDFNALKNIRRAVNVRENHPALSRMSVVGRVAELIPAWRLEHGHGKDYSPYPVMGAPFVILVPEMRAVGSKQITSWIEAPRPKELPLLDEREHLRLVTS